MTNGQIPPPELTPEFREAMHEMQADPTTWALDLQMSHTGNAAFFAAEYGDRVRFTMGRGWLVWDGRRFAEDVNDVQVTGFMRQIVKSWHDDAEGSGSEKTAQAMMQHARRSLNHDALVKSLIQATRIPGILARDDDFDADPLLFNTQNGVVDLRSGQRLAHDPKYLCSRIAGVGFVPDAPAPRWQQFRREIFGGDEAMVTFDRRWDGYCLTGATYEQVYMIAWGDGWNGKSTKFDALRSVLGDYAVDISVSALALRREASNLNTDLARLPGARLAICPEWDEDMRADESMLKSLTGQDVITVRSLYQRPFNFKPQAKIVIYGNHRPGLRGSDTGTWRRPLLTPYTESFTGDRRDEHLHEKLAQETEGILADLVRGCMEWQREGLAVPARVTDATDEYHKDSNDVLQFIAARCVLNPYIRATVGQLHAEYLKWGGAIRTAKKFGLSLRELGYETTRTMNGYVVSGVGIVDGA